jgi:hypothetical protein
MEIQLEEEQKERGPSDYEDHADLVSEYEVEDEDIEGKW